MRYVQRFGAVLFAILLVTSMGTVAMAPAAAMDDVEEADRAYVDDDGQLVLVYEEDHDEPDAEMVEGEFGIETSTGLMNLFYAGEFDDGEFDEEFAAAMEASMSPDAVTTLGELTAEAPEELDDLDVDVQSEQTETTSEASADVEMAFVDEMAEPIAVDAAADLEVTPSAFATSGSVDAAAGPAMGPEQITEMTLTETAGTYELEATERNQIFDWEREGWETEEAAEASLEGQYAGVAMNLGGTADVDLIDHEFEETAEGNFVTLEYAVTFEGVKEGVSELLVDELVAEQELDLDRQEAQAIADRMTALELDRIHYSVVEQGGEIELEWDVAIENYDEAMLGFVEIAESVDDLDDEMADEFDDVEATLEAMEAADAAYVADMELSVQGEADRMSVDLTANSETENYGEYVAELQDRGIMEYTAETTLSMTAGLVGDQVEAELDYETVGEDLLENTLEEMLAFADDDEEFVEAIENFQAANSHFEMNDEEFEVRAAAAFEDLEAFEGFPVETDDGLEIVAIHGVTADGTTTVYVTLHGLDAGVGEGELAEHEFVGDGTEIFLAGDWDEEFPSIDTADVDTYLDVDTGAADDADDADADDADDADDGDADDLPGFGVVAALVAIAGALIAFRRR